MSVLSALRAISTELNIVGLQRQIFPCSAFVYCQLKLKDFFKLYFFHDIFFFSYEVCHQNTPSISSCFDPLFQIFGPIGAHQSKSFPPLRRLWSRRLTRSSPHSALNLQNWSFRLFLNYTFIPALKNRRLLTVSECTNTSKGPRRRRGGLISV